MCNSIKLLLWVLFISMLGLGWMPVSMAKTVPSACVEQGALVWNDWTSTAAGGSGLPAGEPLREYVRCKSCHGWDRLGMDGGYVRRTRNAERPNAGLGDSDTTSRNIAPGMGIFYQSRTDEVLHSGTGRSFEDGSGSWVPVGTSPSPAELEAHEAGYTLGNQHPDFSTTDANAGDIVPTQEQIECVTEFVNFGDSDPKFYFDSIDTENNPATYDINSAASAEAGELFYQQKCLECHGAPGTDFSGDNDGKPADGILAYLRGDGKYSGFVHKARWGIPDTAMTRAAMGSPDSQNMIDLMLYLQELNATSGNAYAIGGSVSGLVGTGLVLQNNADDDLTIVADGSFTFPTPLDDGSSYSVTVKTQPSGPDQNCLVKNYAGTLSGVDVTNVQLTCTLATSCNANIVSGLTENSDAIHEACEILAIGPDFIAEESASLIVSSGLEIWFMTGVLIKSGASLNAAVCGQSLCRTSTSPMPEGCHSCVVKICDIDPACCDTAFGQACLDQVKTICNLDCE